MDHLLTLSPLGLLEWLKEGYVLSFVGGTGFLLFMTMEEMGLPARFISSSSLFLVGLGLGLQGLDLYAVAWAILLVTLASIIGSSVPYWLGRYAARPAIQRAKGFWRLGHYLDVAEEKVRRLGVLGVFVGGLTPGILVATSLIAGTLHVSYVGFLLAVVASAVAWSGAWIALGFLSSRLGQSLLSRVFHRSSVGPAPLPLVGAGVVFVGLLIPFLLRRRRAER